MSTETRQELWGAETRKAVENFPVSGQPIPPPVARWLGRIKGAAARVNAELGLLDADKAERIAAAADRVAAGELDDQFPIDVFQTGSGTSSNMNANEVIAALAGEDVHANDDVNMGQSSDDVFPSAVHLAALDEVTNNLLPALDGQDLEVAARAGAVLRRYVDRERRGEVAQQLRMGSGRAFEDRTDRVTAAVLGTVDGEHRVVGKQGDQLVDAAAVAREVVARDELAHRLPSGQLPRLHTERLSR